MEKKDILIDIDNLLWIWFNIWIFVVGLGRIFRY